MSNVTLDIAGRRYTIACAEGEEPHIDKLGASIDAKLAKLDNLHGQSPERVLLYASLLLADELDEMKAAGTGENVAIQLESLADRLESLANALESA